jgi:Uma2 family endonuclease
MPALTLELRPKAEQTAFNLRRWEEVLADPELQKIEGRVETDRHGRTFMSPPPAPRHGKYQVDIAVLLRQQLPTGVTLTECPLSTADGVRGIDVAWASPSCWGEVGNRACMLRAPEICVEVLSPGNSDEEISEKIALYLDAGAKEVWICGLFGAMKFHGEDGAELGCSALCPGFPKQI